MSAVEDFYEADENTQKQILQALENEIGESA